MEHLKLESATDSPEFWNDAYAISSYCNSLLGATGKSEDVVSIYIGDYDEKPRVAYRREDSRNKYSIYLPKIKDFYSNENLLGDDIKLRKAFLKHEIAHIIYSDMESYNEHHRGDTSDIMFLNNAIEDVRIEWAFGKRFQGANDTFFDVQRKFFNRGKSKIEIDPPDIKNLAFYFMYRSKNFEFDKTLSTEIYDKIFSKYSDFLNLSRKEVSSLIREISKEFYEETKLREEDIKDYKEYLNETYPTEEYEEGDYTQEDQEESEGQGESNYNPNATKKSKDPAPPSFSQGSSDPDKEEEKDNSDDSQETDSSQLEDEDSEEDEEEQTEDSEEDSESSSSDEEELDSDSSLEEDEEDLEEDESDDWDSESDEEEDLSEDERDFKPNDFSNMLVDEMNQNLQDELEDFGGDSNSSNSKNNSLEKFKSNLKDYLEDMDDNGQNKEVVDILKMISGSKDNLIDRIADSQQNLNEFVKYNNSKMKHLGAKVIDASRFLSLSNAKKKKRKKNDTNTRSRYSFIVAKNNKNIISLVNYFKLKFQDKEKSKRFFNKEEGDLNNEALYKILNKKQFDSRIFSRLERSLVTKEDVSFLLDFSGSMDGYKLKNLLESLVVMNEVFTKIGIPFNVFSFTGKDYTQLDFKYNSLAEKMALQKMFSTKMFTQQKGTNDTIYFTANDQFRSRDFKIVYCLINRSTRPEERKRIIELLLNSADNGTRSFKSWHHFFSGSTPECQAVIGIYNTLPKQKLFLINDGEYDSISFHGKELNLIKDSGDSKATNFHSFYNFLYDFFSGKEIILKNSEDEKVFRTAMDIASSIFYKNLTLSGMSKFFQDPNDPVLEQKNTSNFKIIEDIISDLSYCTYKANSTDFYEGKYFIVERKYYQKKDVKHISITWKVIPSFVLQVTKKLIPISKIFENRYYYSGLADMDQNLYLSKDTITDFKDVLKLQFFIAFDSFFNSAYSIIKSEYTYKDLFNKMRSSGWEIYGIGIGNNSSEGYIGKENFTYISNAEDIRKNLEKKIKKIV